MHQHYLHLYVLLKGSVKRGVEKHHTSVSISEEHQYK
jgi:hypothetical protein